MLVNQVKNIYQARGEKKVAYSEKAKELLRLIRAVSIKVVPQSKNANVDVLAKLASTKDAKLLNAVSVKFLAVPSIKQRLEVKGYSMPLSKCVASSEA